MDDLQVTEYSKEDLRDVLALCYQSTKVCSKVLFPNRFRLPFSKLHDEIFDLLDDDSKQLVAIAAPRGFGKTSIVGMSYLAKKILFREKKFIVPISCTATQAIIQSENLKRELTSNKEVGALFGPMKSESFSKELWITTTGTMVLPRGVGQQVRGILHGDYRPDLVVGDDMEDSGEVLNDELRKKLKEWWYSDVMNSIDRASNGWKIVVIGTILHEDSLLANLIEGKVDIALH